MAPYMIFNVHKFISPYTMKELVATHYKNNPHDLPMKKQAFENSTSI